MFSPETSVKHDEVRILVLLKFSRIAIKQPPYVLYNKAAEWWCMDETSNSTALKAQS